MDNYVFITGATSGFGEACARKFSSEGYNLIITGRREQRLTQLQDELRKDGTNIISLCFDVRNLSEVEQAVSSLPEEVKNKISILINNAGLAVGREPIDQGNIDDWERMIDTNIKGLLYVSKSIIPFLKNNQKGHIFNIGSIAGKEVYPMGNVYCGTKHAVDALSRAMRIDLVDYNIKVTNIAPGAAETEFSLVRFKGDQHKADATYDGFEPLVAADIADTIYFVATRPQHVTINDLTIMPTAQASATVFHKE
ncbi:SDR family NAD(P)-dependent oxidoreductase [Crocinitomicaceae bacterium CZZ-1]|uniref:SDR family NAD(P)-dependent oxidoreductase n=1 Tax=Taishania pollutisoli TaxID=2766479 RepID=A0A8J6PD35_9FLAO|nr:SDR family NAD(P)-dependent oxidoreductase [Taishania pollutisoli]MBC9811000.1 SDR family NAD(P)-dependent oxidoreductase [Taishania pollutisoli]MBX2950157.1 SDR family NAD(P)-dependent oxidoreductase [Crocinitomicaceae bacterium]NGF76637.1 SDR family NAD(P)-dependent oxidoreductase [Fluviicola sp. SGL-29]